jgi:hypothetical protein
MSDVHAEFWQRITALRKLEGFGRSIAPDVARVVEADLRRTLKAGTTPDGEKWQPTKDGEAPLQNAESALYVGAYLNKVFVRIKGPEALHDRGRARGRIERQLIPHGQTIPRVMAERIRVVIEDAFAKWESEAFNG